MKRWTGLTILALLAGCASEEKQDRDFFTSGSRDADQRAEQRMAKTEQMRDSGAKGSGQPTESARQSLYHRLGGEKGISAIVDDFVVRVLADPRVNWERKGVERGGMLGIGDKSAEWSVSGESVDKLKKHLVQFLALATGGPSVYEGRDMKEIHKGMKITNTEFDATIGDLKATLDKMGVGIDEQKEILSVIESTRTQVVEER